MLPKTAKDTKDSQSRLDFFLMNYRLRWIKGNYNELLNSLSTGLLLFLNLQAYVVSLKVLF